MTLLTYKFIRPELSFEKPALLLSRLEAVGAGLDIKISVPENFCGTVMINNLSLDAKNGSVLVPEGKLCTGIYSPRLLFGGVSYKMSPFKINDDGTVENPEKEKAIPFILNMFFAFDKELLSMKKEIDLLKKEIKGTDLFTF